MSKVFKRDCRIIRISAIPEVHGGKSLTETLGHVPFEKRLNALMEAGVRLQAARAEDYDINVDLPEEFSVDIGVSRDIGADITDVYVASQAAQARIKSRREARINEARKRPKNAPQADDNKIEAGEVTSSPPKKEAFKDAD